MLLQYKLHLRGGTLSDQLLIYWCGQQNGFLANLETLDLLKLDFDKETEMFNCFKSANFSKSYKI